MNYYERNLGDYYRVAGHLSMLQHGAYTLLLDRYYTTECGIPDDQKYDIARAKTAAERRAVDKVLVQFFRLSESRFWIKNRCEEEIERVRRRIQAARENGSKGGRPKNPETTQRVSDEKPNPLNRLTQSKALQSPSSNLQSSIKNSSEQAGSAPETQRVIHAAPERGDLKNTKAVPKSPRNGEWNAILDRVERALSIERDPAHPDYTTLAKVTALTESQCRSAVQQLTDRGRLPKSANGAEVLDA